MMWNRRTLHAPPVCRLPISLTKQDRATLIQSSSVLKRGLEILADQKLLASEHTLLTRVMYKLNNQFRSEKSMKGLKMMESCLKRFAEVGLASLLTGLLEIVDMTGTDLKTTVYLGSRQMLEFYMVRLMGMAALIRQTMNYTRYTFSYARQHLRHGNLIPQNMIFLGLTGRIWVLLRWLLPAVCDWYRAASQSRAVLVPTQVTWLPIGEELPQDLGEWLIDQFQDNVESTDTDMDSELESLAGGLDSWPALSVGTGDASRVTAQTSTSSQDIGEPVGRNAEPSRLDGAENPLANRRELFRTEIQQLPVTKVFTLVKIFQEKVKTDPDIFYCTAKKLKVYASKVESLLNAYKNRKATKKTKLKKTFRKISTRILCLLDTATDGSELTRTTSSLTDTSSPGSRAIADVTMAMVKPCPLVTANTEAPGGCITDHDEKGESSISQDVEQLQEYFIKHLRTVKDIIKLKRKVAKESALVINSCCVMLTQGVKGSLLKKLKCWQAEVESGGLSVLPAIRQCLVDRLSAVLRHSNSEQTSRRNQQSPSLLGVKQTNGNEPMSSSYTSITLNVPSVSSSNKRTKEQKKREIAKNKKKKFQKAKNKKKKAKLAKAIVGDSEIEKCDQKRLKEQKLKKNKKLKTTGKVVM